MPKTYTGKIKTLDGQVLELKSDLMACENASDKQEVELTKLVSMIENDVNLSSIQKKACKDWVFHFPTTVKIFSKKKGNGNNVEATVAAAAPVATAAATAPEYNQ